MNNKILEYERGFVDPTVDQRDIPHRVSLASYENPGMRLFQPLDYPVIDPSDSVQGLPRVMNWRGNRSCHPVASGGGSTTSRDIQLVLSGNAPSVHLINVDFSEQDLSLANLINSVLKNVLFMRTKLRGANFTGSDLSGSNFTGADLTGANFRNANLTNVDMSIADLTGADFREAILFNTNFSLADLSSAKMGSARLKNTNFFRTNLSGTSFDGASVLESDFSESTIVDTTFKNALISSSDFKDIEALQNIDLTGASVLKLIGIDKATLNSAVKSPTCGCD